MTMRSLSFFPTDGGSSRPDAEADLRLPESAGRIIIIPTPSSEKVTANPQPVPSENTTTSHGAEKVPGEKEVGKKFF